MREKAGALEPRLLVETATAQGRLTLSPYNTAFVPLMTLGVKQFFGIHIRMSLYDGH